MHSKRKNKSLTHVAVIAATACLLAACSSKPETADIQKDLAEVYACPIIELSDVKKVDGADVGGKLYDVAFTHTVSIKGGKEAAAKLFAEWSFLLSQVKPAQLEYEHIEDEVARRNSALRYNSGVVTGETKDDPAVKAAFERVQQMRNRMVAIMPCENMEVVTRLHSMRGTAEEAVNSGKQQIPVPIAIKISGSGRMGKAESGWHFTGMPNLTMVEIVSSEPMTYPSFKPLIAPPQAPTAAELDPPPAKLAAVDATPSDAAPAPVPQGPSFDCAKATTQIEKMICADPKLAQADAATVALYKTALAASVNPDGFKQGQTNWRKNVRDACADAACLSRAYQERQRELK